MSNWVVRPEINAMRVATPMPSIIPELQNNTGKTRVLVPTIEFETEMIVCKEVAFL